MEYGFLSVLPVIVAVTVSIAYKNVILALFASVLLGILILIGGHPIAAVTTMMQDYLFVQLTDSYNAGVLVLLVFIGGFIKLMEKSGGAAAFAEKVSHIINTRVKVQIAAWIGGIIIFFSDLGTPLIVGPIFEPLFDKLKVSREKLAWIIDSTASPVAVLVPFIGWGVYIMGLIQKEYEALSIAESDWTAFIQSIPFNIYSILAVIMVPLVAYTGYEFSSMAKAEKRVQETGKLFWENSKPMRMPETINNVNSNPMLIFLPILVLLVSLFGILAPLGFPLKQVPGGTFRAALSTAYLFAAITLMALMLYYKVNTFEETFSIYVKGMSSMMSVAVILVLSWSLSSVSGQLGTADYITQLTKGTVPSWAIPAIIFIIGAIMSFATGTSWGTYAILMPIVIPMAVALGSPVHACIGAVLSGGMFGDHCSPISDTTILASTGAGCDHVDHVKTQLSYAVLNAIISFGAYIVAGFTGSPIALVLAIAAMVVVLPILSKAYGHRIKNTHI